MAMKHSPTHERVTMNESGRLLIPEALLAELGAAYGHCIDVQAELNKAEAWVSANVVRRKGDYTRLVRSWLLRAATEADRGGLFILPMARPKLSVVQGSVQAPTKRRAALVLVHPVVR